VKHKSVHAPNPLPLPEHVYEMAYVFTKDVGGQWFIALLNPDKDEMRWYEIANHVTSYPMVGDAETKKDE
jgi:hypothetical protein